MNKTTFKEVKRLAKSTTFYIMVVGIAIIILLPVFFLCSISLMSDYECYDEWPLQVLPAYKFNFKLSRNGEKFRVSIYNHSDQQYDPIYETRFLEDMYVFIKKKTNCYITPKLLNEKAMQFQYKNEVEFSLQRDWLANYKTFFRVTPGAKAAIWRSLFVAVLTIAISLVIGGLAGYGFARYAFKGKNSLKIGVLFVRMFPGVSIAIPMVIILGSIGLYDNPFGLSLVYAIGQIGLTIWITASIFMSIPEDLEEAAMVFGTTRLGAFFHITLPLAIPGLAACAMYAFIGSWNETVQAIVLTQFNPTFPVLVYQSLVGTKGMINLSAAGSVIMALPAVVFTLIIRRYILRMWGGVSV